MYDILCIFGVVRCKIICIKVSVPSVLQPRRKSSRKIVAKKQISNRWYLEVGWRSLDDNTSIFNSRAEIYLSAFPLLSGTRSLVGGWMHLILHTLTLAYFLGSFRSMPNPLAYFNLQSSSTVHPSSYYCWQSFFYRNCSTRSIYLPCQVYRRGHICQRSMPLSPTMCTFLLSDGPWMYSMKAGASSFRIVIWNVQISYASMYIQFVPK